MPRTSHSSPVERYHAEAAHALSRIRHYQALGDQLQMDRWHQAWSLAQTAADAELREKGAGARVVRLNNPPPLRPLPADLCPPTLPPVPPPEPESAAAATPTDTAPSPEPSEDSLTAALERHDRIERALRAGGPNPLLGELDEDEWQEHLAAFQYGGPYDCELLQEAEGAVEALVEMLPEYWEPEEEAEEEPEDQFEPALAPMEAVALPACVRIYEESLSELTEDELRADLAVCLQDGRRDTAALIEAEIRRREREPLPAALEAVLESIRSGKNVSASGTEPREPAPPRKEPRSEAARAAGRTEPPVVTTVAESPQGAEPLERAPEMKRPARSHPRRPAAVCSAAPAVSEPPSETQVPPPPVHPATDPELAGYFTKPAWIDTAGRTRTWALFAPSGERMAEIATRRDAEKLEKLFNRLLAQGVVPADVSS